ncbi:asparagine synthetase B family protein [Orrella marina]|uniref:Asparagine synthetase domain-containing protein n=1 Tax=Orrella marina TaxID=2163011 RepID=A0A2R4XFB4_9BURK|nr:hypothetical protein [Orrella marina]AWB32498.1 hypothetical protein DBV39_00825 [Orrella marina]
MSVDSDQIARQKLDFRQGNRANKKPMYSPKALMLDSLKNARHHACQTGGCSEASPTENQQSLIQSPGLQSSLYARGYLAWLPGISGRLGATSEFTGVHGIGALPEPIQVDPGHLSPESARPAPMGHDGWCAQWRTHQDRQITLQYDSRLPISVASRDNCYVLLLGHVVSLADDPGQPDHQDCPDISAMLARRLLSGMDAFLDALDLCSGRFVCFYKSADHCELQVVSDATSMRSVFYSEACAGIISSHPSLLAQALGPVIGCRLDPAVQTFLSEARPRPYNMSYLPGFATLYEHVYQLPSNNALRLTDNHLTRIFPRNPRKELSLDEVVSRCSTLFRRTVESFSRNYKTVASLTAGLDSRLTLAACRTSLPRLSFFCYTRAREPVNYVDVALANQIAGRFGLQIHNVTFDYEHPPSDPAYTRLLKDLKQNNTFEHFYPLAHAYATQIPGYDLHLRSNIGEALRAYYHRGAVGRITNGQASLIEKFAAIYCKEALCKTHPFVLTQSERYLRLSGLLEGSLGFDVMTLYELEHSIAVWQSGLVRESDIAFETVCIFNCREVLRLFMSLPFDDWLEARGMYGCLEMLWPELLDIPVNPSLSDLSDEAFESLPFVDMGLVHSKTLIRCRIEILGNSLVATASVRDVFAANATLEYAFYVYVNGTRHDTVWYTPSPALTYPLDDSMRGAELSVRAFARHVQAPDTKVASTSPSLLYR